MGCKDVIYESFGVPRRVRQLSHRPRWSMAVLRPDSASSPDALGIARHCHFCHFSRRCICPGFPAGVQTMVGSDCRAEILSYDARGRDIAVGLG